MKAYKIDPRTRLVLVSCLTLLALVFNDLPMLLGILFSTVIILIALKEKTFFVILKKLKWLLLFFCVVAILQSLFNPLGQVVVTLFNRPIITVGGLILGLTFLIRMSIIMLSATIIAAGGTRNINQGLIQLRVPYEIAFMTSTAIGFLPKLAEEMKNSLNAIQLRGIRLKKISMRDKIKIYTYIFMPVISGIIIKAKDLSLAMDMRGFRAYSNRSSYIVLKLKPLDYAIIIVGMVTTLGALIGKVIF